MIGPASHEDIPRLVAMGQKFHGMSGQAAPFDPDAVAGLLGQMIDSPAAVVLASDDGVIGGALSPAYCAPQWLMAVELFWWAERGGLRLLSEFEKWAQEIGAHEVRMTSLSAYPRAAEILSRRGYAASEISHTKVI